MGGPGHALLFLHNSAPSPAPLCGPYLWTVTIARTLSVGISKTPARGFTECVIQYILLLIDD